MWPRERQRPAQGHTARPTSLSQAASISFGDLASGRSNVLFLPAKCSSAGPDFQAPHSLPCPGSHCGFSPDRHSYVACLLMSRAPGADGHLGPHGGSEGSHQIPGLPRAGSKGLEESRHLGECCLTQDCQHWREGCAPGDEGFLVNFNGLGEFIKLLCCCPERTEVLGHASPPPFLSSCLSSPEKPYAYQCGIPPATLLARLTRLG